MNNKTLKNKPRVLFIEPVLAHYRRDVFNDIFSSNSFETKILAGNNYQGIKIFHIDNSIIQKFYTIRLLNHTFYYLKRSLSFVRSYKPDVIVCSGIDFHHIHTILIFLWAKFTKRKFVWWSHGGFGNQGKVGKCLRGYIYRHSDYIIAYSQQGYNNLQQLGVNDFKIKNIGNSINYDDYGFNKKNFKEICGNKPFTLLFSGRLTPAKRIDVLLKALKELKDNSAIEFRCFIVGCGIIEELKKFSAKLNINDIVEFVGEKYGDEVVPYFKCADIFVYPSGIGLSILHALSYGLPVITTNNYNLHFPEVELLEPGVNGDTFIDNDHVDLARKIQNWVVKLQYSKEKISNDCINSIFEKEYIPAEQAKKIINVLTQLIFK